MERLCIQQNHCTGSVTTRVDCATPMWLVYSSKESDNEQTRNRRKSHLPVSNGKTCNRTTGGGETGIARSSWTVVYSSCKLVCKTECNVLRSVTSTRTCRADLIHLSEDNSFPHFPASVPTNLLCTFSSSNNTNTSSVGKYFKRKYPLLLQYMISTTVHYYYTALRKLIEPNLHT